MEEFVLPSDEKGIEGSYSWLLHVVKGLNWIVILIWVDTYVF